MRKLISRYGNRKSKVLFAKEGQPRIEDLLDQLANPTGL